MIIRTNSRSHHTEVCALLGLERKHRRHDSCHPTEASTQHETSSIPAPRHTSYPNTRLARHLARANCERDGRVQIVMLRRSVCPAGPPPSRGGGARCGSKNCMRTFRSHHRRPRAARVRSFHQTPCSSRACIQSFRYRYIS